MPPTRKRSIRRKKPVKRLLDELLPNKVSYSIDATSQESVIEYIPSNDKSNKVVSKSSITKEATTAAVAQNQKQEKKKSDQGTSYEIITLDQSAKASSLIQLPSIYNSNENKSTECRPLVSANSSFFYSPMYRRYFGLTPPNPRLYNPRLLEDYIDWYMNVHMEEEELPWQWIK